MVGEKAEVWVLREGGVQANIWGRFGKMRWTVVKVISGGIGVGLRLASAVDLGELVVVLGGERPWKGGGRLLGFWVNLGDQLGEKLRLGWGLDCWKRRGKFC